MAMFGSLGKLVGLDTSFGKGVATGFFTGIKENIEEDKKQTQTNISRLAQIRLDRASRDIERNQTETRANLKIIQDMEGKLGDINAVEFLVRKYGVTEAQNVANNLYKKQAMMGGPSVYNVVDKLGLEERDGNVTATQLADFATPGISVPKMEDLGSVAVGFSKLFGNDELAKQQMIDTSDAEIAVLTGNYGKTSLNDMPPAIQGKGFYDWQIYSSDDPATNASNLSGVISRLQDAHSKATSTEKTAIEQEMMAAKAEQELMVAQSQYKIGQDLNISQVEHYTSSITTLIAQKYGLGKVGDYLPTKSGTGVIFNTLALSQQAQNMLTPAVNKQIKEIQKAQKNGVNAADISAAIQNINRGQNKFFIFVPADSSDPMSKPSLEATGEQFIDNEAKDGNGNLIFPGVPPVTPGPINATVSSSSTVSNSNQAASVGFQQTVDALVDKIKTAASTQTSYAVDLRKLAKIIDPNTNQPIGAAEAKKLAGVP